MKPQALAQISETKRADGPIVRLSDVVKVHKPGNVEVSAIKGLTFDIPRQRFSMIVGPSSSGKTTLRNLTGCIDKPPKEPSAWVARMWERSTTTPSQMPRTAKCRRNQVVAGRRFVLDCDSNSLRAWRPRTWSHNALPALWAGQCGAVGQKSAMPTYQPVITRRHGKLPRRGLWGVQDRTPAGTDLFAAGGRLRSLIL